ncbi:response regulator [Sphingomonas sp. CGMCC 1.13654]|uniref:histidine kinase n=1 Tax=Sphingomonas chungangi TaxID=2683589 RepID=A0A838L9A0_9SPHN|nr:ATP-binding protein [Sphingomonas chungangi]MBA2934098.1 response regulator [Sphingomonas chungangi]MVW57139.1 response regulator [Sphingomonas chungangi]
MDGVEQGPVSHHAAWSRLIAAGERLATARSMKAVVDILRATARDIAGADGIAVVLRDGEFCHYAAEDAVGALWTGQRFPMVNCISGWAMMNRQTVAIPDIRLDERIPQAAYRPTFVRSLVMVPVGNPRPVAAIGAYWSDVRDHAQETVERLEALARSAAIALENIRLLESVQESDRLRALALAAGGMGVWSYDVRTGELTTSEAFRASIGRDPAEPLSRDELVAAIPPEDYAAVDAAASRSMAEGTDYDIEHRVLTPAGETRWIANRARPVFAADGSPLSLIGVSMDITARKRMEDELRGWATTLEQRVEHRTAELVQAQEQLCRSQKLEAMGQLTGGVAHDFNNLLTPIMGSLDMLHRKGLGTDREKRLVGGALESAERARMLVQRLLAFARRQPLTPQPIDVSALLVEIGPLIGTTLGPRIALTIDAPTPLPPAFADRNQIEMALLNLAVNARDAMPDGGRLTVAAVTEDAAAGHAADLAEGRYVRLTVSDTGIGMDEETRTRAVEPFYSTKRTGEGTGLGLSMVHGLMSQLGGAMALTSAPGVGTQVDLWLPVSARPLVVELRIAEEPEMPAAGTVLLVDDQDLVRATTAHMLEELGFGIIHARSGEEALRLIGEGAIFDIVVTDHLMPGITGAELAQTIRGRVPNAKILLVSGYADEGIAADLPRLAKPFRAADLAERVHSLLRDEAA